MYLLHRLVKPVVCAVALVAASLSAHSVGVAGQGTWETTLQARDINGDGVIDAYYDSALNISWLANWNVNGLIGWGAANAWAAGLDVFGTTGWRLPGITDTGTTGCNFSRAGGTDCGSNVDTVSSEMAHMFYETLGNKAYFSPVTGTPGQPGWGLANTANFINMQADRYWSGTPYALNPDWAWDFSVIDGTQFYNAQVQPGYAVAVHDGDVSTAVPEPQALAMMLAGLGGVLALVRRRSGSRSR